MLAVARRLSGYLDAGRRIHRTSYRLASTGAKADDGAGVILLQAGLRQRRRPRPVSLPRSRLEGVETNAAPKECGIIAELPFHATCRMKEPMNQPAQDSKDKRERFKQLAQNEKLRTGRTFAADVRRSNIHPSVHKLTAWRKRNRLSQRAAVAVLQKYYFHLTFASLRIWEEGRRSRHPHTAAILEKFLNDHPTVPPPK